VRRSDTSASRCPRGDSKRYVAEAYLWNKARADNEVCATDGQTRLPLKGAVGAHLDLAHDEVRNRKAAPGQSETNQND
jgi:hypothetical protein